MIQQLFMGGSNALRAHVFESFNNAGSHQLFPYPVHYCTRHKRVLLVRKPHGKAAPVLWCSFWTCKREGSRDAWLNFLAECKAVAAFENFGWPSHACRIFDDHRNRFHFFSKKFFESSFRV